MIRAVLFDFDDTLITYPRFRSAARRELFDAGAARVYAFLHARKARLPRFDRFLKRQRRLLWQIHWRQRLTFAEPDPRRFFRRLCLDYNLQSDDTALATLGWLWHEPLAERAALNEGALTALNALRQAGNRLALVADTPLLSRVMDHHLMNLGLLEFFPARAYSSEIGARMPDGRLYQAALQELKIEARDAVMVSANWARSLRGAHQIGLAPIYISNARNNSRHQARRVISSLQGLPTLLESMAANAPSVDGQIPQIN